MLRGKARAEPGGRGRGPGPAREPSPRAGRTVGWGSGGREGRCSRLPEQAGWRLLCHIHEACGGTSPRQEAILRIQASRKPQPQKPVRPHQGQGDTPPAWSEAGDEPPRAASGSSARSGRSVSVAQAAPLFRTVVRTGALFSLLSGRQQTRAARVTDTAPLQPPREE